MKLSDYHNEAMKGKTPVVEADAPKHLDHVTDKPRADFDAWLEEYKKRNPRAHAKIVGME